MIVPGMFVCSSFLISVCMFIVSKALFISSATVIVRAGGAIWLNPFATVLFSVCSAVTVECCVLYPCCMGVFGMVALPGFFGVESVMRVNADSLLIRVGPWKKRACRGPATITRLPSLFINRNLPHIVIGDFNSHSTTWGSQAQITKEKR